MRSKKIFIIAPLRSALILGCSFLACGCHSMRMPPAPSSLSVNKAKTEAMEQAKSFAQGIVSEKKTKTKEPAETKVKAQPAKAKLPKLDDPAWESIQKQKSKAEKTFTLTELVDLALKNNPKTRKSWENTLVARAVEKQAESAWYPQLTISQGMTREKQKLLAGNIDDFHYGPSAKLTYLLLDFGGRSSKIESTFQKVLQANSLYDQSLQDLILEVQSAYYNYYSAIAQVEAEELDVKNTKEDYVAAEERYNVGLVPWLDVLQAKSNYESSLYNLESAKGALKTAKANLTQAVGVSADANIDIVLPSKELPTQVNEDDVVGLIEESIRMRPDISALRADMNSKKAAATAALSDLLPSLNLNMDAQQDKYKYYNSGGFKKTQNNVSGAVSVDWDVFDGFSNWYKKRQADHEASVALDSLIQAELEASTDVWVKYYDFNTAVEKLKYSQAFFDTSTTSYDLALESYKAGLKSILDLLQSQSNLSQARSRLIQSKQELFIALANLAHSTGTPNIKIGLTKNNSGNQE